MTLRSSLALLAFGLAPRLAAAQAPAEIEASWRSLVAAALAAQTAGDHPRALELGQRAVTIHASPSLYRFVAQEQSHLGLLVPALTSAQRCVDALAADRNAPERASTMATCSTLVRTLQARVGHLVLEVASPPPEGLSIMVAGSALPSALYGVPYLVNPGRVTIDATATGRAALHRSVEVPTGGTVPVRVELPVETPTPATREAAPVHAAAPAPSVPPPPGPSPRAAPGRQGSARRTLAWATAIGGAGGMVTGAVLAGMREGAVSSFNGAGCVEDQGVATPAGNCRSDQSTANALSPAVVASFVAGGALAAASVVLWVTLPSRAADRASIACAPALGMHGVVCGGRF
ncbi:MAG: hypothetical protein IPF99_30790 [Deltaproteobacteria bacterium]|nr:hypothetical protein [Deltaproteobacteria bacterium]